MKIINDINVTKMQNVKPKRIKIPQAIVENKKTISKCGKIAGFAGLMGLAIYAVSAYKPSGSNLDIYNDYVQKEVVQTKTVSKIAPYEEKRDEVKAKLERAKSVLERDLAEQKTLENMLGIPGLYDREYFQQQHDVLNGFIEMDKEEIEKLTAELAIAEDAYQQMRKRY